MSSNKYNISQSSQIDLITKRVTNRYKRRFILAVFCVPASITWFGIVLRGINMGLDIFTIFLIAFICLLILIIMFWPIYLIAMDNQVNSSVTELLNERISNDPITLGLSETRFEAYNPEEEEEVEEEPLNDMNLSDPVQSQMASYAVRSLLSEDQLKGQ